MPPTKQEHVEALKLARRALTRVKRQNLPFDISAWVREAPDHESAGSIRLTDVRALLRAFPDEKSTPQATLVRAKSPHICTTAACIAGHMALDPEVQDRGGFSVQQGLSSWSRSEVETLVKSNKGKPGRKIVPPGLSIDFFHNVSINNPAERGELDDDHNDFSNFCESVLCERIGLAEPVATLLFAPHFYRQVFNLNSENEVTVDLALFVLARMIDRARRGFDDRSQHRISAWVGIARTETWISRYRDSARRRARKERAAA